MPEPSSAVAIRSAKPDDAQAIWSIRTSAIETSCKAHYASQDIAKWASAPMPEGFGNVITEMDFFVAERDSQMVGWGFLDQRAASVEAVFVAPDCQRCGVGRSILATLEDAARRGGLTSLTLSATLNAVAFYQAAGFRAEGPSQFHHPLGFDLDCVIMRKELLA